MADYHYTPKQDGRVAEMLHSLKTLDCMCY